RAEQHFPDHARHRRGSLEPHQRNYDPNYEARFTPRRDAPASDSGPSHFADGGSGENRIALLAFSAATRAVFVPRTRGDAGRRKQPGKLLIVRATLLSRA